VVIRAKMKRTIPPIYLRLLTLVKCYQAANLILFEPMGTACSRRSGYKNVMGKHCCVQLRGAACCACHAHVVIDLR
jgi:hypothetical protein